MSLLHTSAGLSNLHIFVGVDAIVFVEGGSSQSVEQVLAGRFESKSDDVGFWQYCFSELEPNLRVQFRAVGSKPTLVTIAQGVASGLVTSVYVAMDRDFDNHLGHMIRAPRVLYTFGYSWENDVWKREVLEEVFYTLCPVCRTTVVIGPITLAALDGFERTLRWPTYADFLCVTHGISLLPRRGGQRVLSVSKSVPPSIERSAIRQCMRRAKAERTRAIRPAARVKTNPLVDCCGHLVSTFGHSLLGYLFRKFCKGSSTHPRQLLDAIALNTFFEKIRQGNYAEVRLHYQQQLTA